MPKRLNLFVIAVFVTCMHAAANLSLRIMSFNIQQPYGTSWEGRRDKAVQILINENADVVGTQEAINSQRDYLIANTSNYNWYGLGRDGGDAGEGSFIFYKKDKYTIDLANSGNFWCSNTPASPSRYGGSYNRIATYVRLRETSTGTNFYLYNLHNYMPAESSYRMDCVKLVLQRIFARTHKSDPVYLTGDFNSPENDAVTQWIKNGSDNSTKMRDTYRDYDPTGSVTTGFGTKYDYIYHPNTTNYKTTKSHVVVSPSGASDHMPIVADVVFTPENANPADTNKPMLCIFDYDLTLTSNKCTQTQNDPANTCWTTSSSCPTYNWNDQCLGIKAVSAIEECVKRGAYIGIASWANRDPCWDDKVVSIVTKNLFPSLLLSDKYNNPSAKFMYPKLDDKANWNCNTCAYHMNSSIDKSTGIRRIMAHYGLNSASEVDRRRVIFWDDGSYNITNVNTNLPGVRTVSVARLPPTDGNGGGCGITQANIDQGWQGIPTSIQREFNFNSASAHLTISYLTEKHSLKIYFRKNITAKLEVYNLAGKRILQTNVIGQNGQSQEINLSNLGEQFHTYRLQYDFYQIQGVFQK